MPDAVDWRSFFPDIMPLAAGHRLGPYTVERLLGSGGMGEVYVGVDSRLGRAVALKVITPQVVGDDASRRRFETEARAASALNHPAIVTIYDVGDSEGVSWIAMELIEGRTLREVGTGGLLPIRQVWWIARQLADGLAAAHTKGIVHRDLKPANIMLTEDGRAKILDFGLARHDAAPALATASTIISPGVEPGTVAGTILGTVGYMSPEQAAGQSADFRADQFSLGAVVYELLAGRRAFDRPTAVETLSAIIRDEPPPLSSLRRDVSDAFQRVLSRCMEKSPARRFETTRELAIALEALTPESLAAPGATETRRRRIRFSPARPRILAVAAMLTLLLGAAYLWSQRDVAGGPAIASVAVLPFRNTAEDPDLDYIGDGLTDALIDHLSRVPSLRVMARATVMRYATAPDPREAARALGVGAVVTGALARRGSQLGISAELIDGVTGERLWGQTFDRPIADLMRVEQTIVASIADGLRLRLSGEEKTRLGGFGTSNPEAYALFLKGRFLMQRDTEDADLEARSLFMQAAQLDPNFIDAHLAVASMFARAAGSGYMPATEAATHGDAALARAAAIDPNHIAVQVATAQREFTRTRDWAAAERHFRAVMNDPGLLRTVQYHPIALFFVAIGRADEAVALVERALVVDPGNLESRVMLGNFELYAGRLDEALRSYTAIATEVPDDPRPLFGAADVHKRRGDFVRAAEARRQAHELAGDRDGAAVFARATTEREYRRAEITIAKRELSALEELATQRYIPAFDLARLHAQIGNRARALDLLEQAAVADAGYVGLSMLKVDEAWDSVRDDPGFAAIVRKIRIP